MEAGGNPNLLIAAVLLTSDAHLRSIDHVRLTWELNACDLSVPIVATPREIVVSISGR